MPTFGKTVPESITGSAVLRAVAEAVWHLRRIEESVFLPGQSSFSSSAARVPAFPLCPNPHYQFPELFLENTAEWVG